MALCARELERKVRTAIATIAAQSKTETQPKGTPKET